MKKTETIALYRDAFLEGKDEETRRKFDEKDINKQYSSIIAWRRRRNISSDDDEQPSAALALELLKKAKKVINDLDSLSPRDSEKLWDAANEVADDVNNFDRIKKSRLIKELESEKEKLQRQGENLERKIEALKQQLS